MHNVIGKPLNTSNYKISRHWLTSNIHPQHGHLPVSPRTRIRAVDQSEQMPGQSDADLGIKRHESVSGMLTSQVRSLQAPFCAGQASAHRGAAPGKTSTCAGFVLGMTHSPNGLCGLEEASSVFSVLGLRRAQLCKACCSPVFLVSSP